VLYIYQNYIFLSIILQGNIDTVPLEGVDSLGAEDCVNIKTEQDYIELVRTVKTEDEVSVVCWFVLW
jgi:hypothetical protein